MKQDFEMKKIILQNESKLKRKQQRQMKRQFQLEERATFLALRALRRQSTFHSTSTAIETVLNTSSQITSFPTNAGIRTTKTTKSTNVATTTPLPTLSFSATRNYKRREDYVNDDHNLLEIEQKLYGQRFKKAYNVYYRLLQTLEEMRVESKQRAKDYLLDKVEQSVQVIATTTTNTASAAVMESTAKTLPSRELLEKDIKESIEMNQRQQERMTVITTLSLYRN